VNKITETAQHIEQSTGAMQTYAAATIAGSVGFFSDINWLAILSCIAVLVRIGIDIPRLLASWKKHRESGDDVG
jgi:hypothetical protein